MRLLSPFGSEALPIIKVLRTDSTSSGVRTIVFNSELRAVGSNLEEQRLSHLTWFDFESIY